MHSCNYSSFLSVNAITLIYGIIISDSLGS